jgi:HEAT repeat protein
MEVIRTVTEWRPNEYPSEEAIGVITTILADWDHSERRKQAALILAHTAERRPDPVVSAVESHTDRIAGLLTSDDPIGRHAGATLLSHVAERNPESVATPVDPLVELLDDDHKIVRGSALWALRYIGTPETAATVQETATNDPDPEIRDLAEECARDLRQDGG